MRLTQLAQLAGRAPPESSGSSSPSGEPPPPPDTRARAATRDAAQKIGQALGAAAEDLDAVPPGATKTKPYTAPPGWKAPTLGEQFRYVSHGASQPVWGAGCR